MSLLIIDGLNYLHDALEHRGESLIDIFHDYANRPEVVIWVWEGKNSKQRRKDLYPLYKKNREGKNKEYIYAALELFREILNYANCFQIAVDGYEGDDVIASLCKIYADQEKFIQSTDKDFLPLLDDKTKGFMWNLLTDTDKSVPLEYVRLYKTFVGDPSDNIKGIPSFGKRAFESIPQDIFHEAMVTADQDFLLQSAMQYMKPKHYGWIMENMDELFAMWNIVGFYFIEPEVLSANLVKGSPDQSRLDAIFKAYLNPVREENSHAAAND